MKYLGKTFTKESCLNACLIDPLCKYFLYKDFRNTCWTSSEYCENSGGGSKSPKYYKLNQ